MLIISIFNLLGNMKLKQIKQPGQQAEHGTPCCSQGGCGSGDTAPWPHWHSQLLMPVCHLNEAATLASSLSKCDLMLTRLLSQYLEVYFRNCELADHGPHEAHMCVLLGPQDLRENKKLEFVASI